MSGSYLSQHGSTKKTPQSEPMRPDQVENSAGGHVFSIGAFERLKRFLILGAEGGTYYVGERDFVRGNLDALREATEQSGTAVVSLVVDISQNGRAKSNDPALFALAYVSVHGIPEARAAAYDALPKVARIGTHLFHFIEYREGFGGWSRGLRRAVAAWYNDRPLHSLAVQLVKYRQRDGWSHRDVLRLAHVKPNSPMRDLFFRFATKGEFGGPNVELSDEEAGAGNLINGFRLAQDADTASASARLVSEYNLPREAVKPEHLTDPEVWEALLPSMPPEAMIRNLATMTRIGLVAPFKDATATVIERLHDREALERARIHPLTVLAALMTYKSGQGDRGGATWDPVAQVVDALNDAFHLAFDFVEPTGKRHLLAVDVSNSMWHAQGRYGLGGLPPATAAAVMTMVTARTEALYETVAFAGADCGRGIAYELGEGPSVGYGGLGRHERRGFTPMAVTPSMRLDAVVAEYRALAHVGRTDCSLPMQYAMQAEREVDVFVIYTDNETWSGEIHPAQALAEYRRKSGIDAKLVVVGMTATDFSIADPKDPGMLDVVGFDTAAPSAIAAFARGDL